MPDYKALTLLIIRTYRLLGLEETDSVHSEPSAGNNAPVSPHVRRRSSNASEGSKGSIGSGGAGRMVMNKNLSGSSTLATLRKNEETGRDLTFNYVNK